MIDVAIRGPVAILTLSHGKSSALDLELCRALESELRRLESSDPRALVLTGRGSIFSAGVDLLRVLDGGPDYLREFFPAMLGAFEALFFHPKPVVAAVNGHAIAGGCILACAADRSLAAAGPARIGAPELLVGVPFPTLPLEIVRFAAASQYVQEIALGGATFLPDDALRRGLVDEVVAPGELLERAVEAARSMAESNPLAFRLTKEQLRRPVRDRLDRDGAAHDAAALAGWCAPETLAAIRGYVERTFKKRDS